MSEKPVIFISHSSKDKELAQMLKQQIEFCFDNGVEAFAADVEPGENWFEKIMGKLNLADAIIVLITPNSVNSSHWVWFELGYFWARHDDLLKDETTKRKICYPLATPQIEIPNPIKDLRIQWIIADDVRQMKRFFRQLCEQFRGGTQFESLDYSNLANSFSPTKVNRKQANALAKDVDTKYLNYSDEEFCEILDDYLNSCADEYYTAQFEADNIGEPWLIKNREYLFNGQLIDYKTLDDVLNLPQGTSRKFLKAVAARYNLVPEANSDHNNTIRFSIVEKSDQQQDEKTSSDDIPF